MALNLVWRFVNIVSKEEPDVYRMVSSAWRWIRESPAARETSKSNQIKCIYIALLWTMLTNLQTTFNAIQLSFRVLQLLLNASKTKCMLFNPSLLALARPTSINTLDGSDLEYVDNYKYLGLVPDSY